MSGIKFLVVEDDELVRTAVKDSLEQAYPAADIRLADSVVDAKKCFQNDWVPNVAIVDHLLRGKDTGYDLISSILKDYLNIRVISLTGHATDIAPGGMGHIYESYQALCKTYSDQRMRVIEKSTSKVDIIGDLLRVVDYYVNLTRGQSTDEFEKLLMLVPTSSTSMRSFLNDLVPLILGNEKLVLLTGETGAGKTFLGEIIHEVRKHFGKTKGEFRKMTLPNEFMFTELFGQEKGAFTGADHDKSGAVEDSNDGTFLLDEIGAASSENQGHLLQLFGDFTYQTRGNSKDTIKTNAFFVLATNRDLVKEQAEGKFQHDLLDRILPYKARVPSLSERREDISILSELFVSNWNNKTGYDIRISPSLMMHLNKIDFPNGGVRELKNCIDKACSKLKIRGERQLSPADIEVNMPEGIGEQACSLVSDEQLSIVDIEDKDMKIDAVAKTRVKKKLDEYESICVRLSASDRITYRDIDRACSGTVRSWVSSNHSKIWIVYKKFPNKWPTLESKTQLFTKVAEKLNKTIS